MQVDMFEIADIEQYMIEHVDDFSSKQTAICYSVELCDDTMRQFGYSADFINMTGTYSLFAHMAEIIARAYETRVATS